MILRSHKDVYKEVAITMDKDPELIKLVGDFTWADLTDRMIEFKTREMYMYGLGCFRFRRKRALKYIERSKDIKLRLIQMGRSEEVAQEGEDRVKEKIEKMTPRLKEWDELDIIYDAVQERRRIYDAERNIQKQNSNLGGDTK